MRPPPLPLDRLAAVPVAERGLTPLERAIRRHKIAVRSEEIRLRVTRDRRGNVTMLETLDVDTGAVVSVVERSPDGELLFHLCDVNGSAIRTKRLRVRLPYPEPPPPSKPPSAASARPKRQFY